MNIKTKTIGDLFGSIEYKGDCGFCGHHFTHNVEHCAVVSGYLVCGLCVERLRSSDAEYGAKEGK